MADTNAPAVDPPASSTDTQPDLNAINERLTKLESENERLKGSLSAKDKALNALQKEKEKLENEGLSEAEIAKKAALEEKNLYIKNTVDSFVDALNLDEKTAGLISGESGLQIKEKAEALKAYKASVLTEANAEIERLKKEVETLKGNMPNPGGGSDTPDAKTMKRAEFNNLNVSQQAKLALEGVKVID